AVDGLKGRAAEYGGAICIGASQCTSGMCSRSCDGSRQCPAGFSCATFQTVDGNGAIVDAGYCLRSCAASSDCPSRLCSRDLHACVTTSLPYDVGSVARPF